MKHRIPLASAAALLVAAVPFGRLWSGTNRPAYGIQQTVEAFNLVRFVHVTLNDPNGKITDERWIEIGADGNQTRYFQRGGDANLALTIVDDGQTTSVYYEKRHTVVLYDHSRKQYQLVGEFRRLLILQRYKSSRKARQRADDPIETKVLLGGHRYGCPCDYADQAGIDSFSAPVR